MENGASHQIWVSWGFSLSKAPIFGGWHLFWCLLIVGAVAVEAEQVTAQNGNWQPDAFADYLLSGQTPHPAVVRIVAAEQGAASLGSGVLVDANHEQAIVLTNWHVVRDSRSAVLVQFPDGFQTAGTVVRMDEAWDLAAIVIWKPPAIPVPLAATPPNPGDLLTIAGYGRGPYRAQTGRCTEYLSPGTGYPKEFVELSAGARQGDSGGPILNDRGELAGVLFGQNSGRTIGSCSTRLRTFLASIGSRGITPEAAAALTAARGASDLGQGGAGQEATRFRMATATVDEPGWQRVSGPNPALNGTAAVLQPPGTGSYRAPPARTAEQVSAGRPPPAEPAWATPTISLPTTAELAAIFDVSANGQAMLSAAGGIALAVLGLRTLFGGRLRATETRRTRTNHDLDQEIDTD
jgi:hypothetical protein